MNGTNSSLTPAAWDRQDALALTWVHPLSSNRFCNVHNLTNRNGTLYGGQVFAQALQAATATVSGRHLHSCHAYFLRPGRGGDHVTFDVARTRDGGSFSSRSVAAVQIGEDILQLQCSFSALKTDFDHAASAPNVPPPDSLEDLDTLVERQAKDCGLETGAMRAVPYPFDVRPVEGRGIFARSDAARRQFWLRVDRPLATDDPAQHRIMLAYLSDFWLCGAALQPHASAWPDRSVFYASLDHAIWFHRPFRADEWLLHDTDSPSVNTGTGFSRGLIFAQDGRLVASTAQEIVLRRAR